MNLFTLYNLIMIPVVTFFGWKLNSLWRDLVPYMLFWWNNRIGADYGKLPAPKEKVIKDLGSEYSQQPLRKRLVKQRDKDLN